MLSGPPSGMRIRGGGFGLLGLPPPPPHSYPVQAMGASSPMRDLPVVRCSNIYCALRHLWRARCRKIVAQSIRTLSTAEYLPCWRW